MHFEEAEFRSNQTNRNLSFIFLSATTMAGTRALTLQLLGRVSEALKFADEGLRRTRESRHLFSLGLALALRAALSNYWRQPDVARAHAEEAIALSEDNGFVQFLNLGRVHHGWALIELGELQQGSSEMEEAVAALRRKGGASRLQYFISQLARGYARTGQTEKSLAMLDDALTHIERTGEKVDQAEMLRLKGEMLLMRDPAATAEAESCVRAAVEVARAQEAKWWELRSTVSLARMLRDTHSRDEARTLLANIYGWFTEGFDLPDLKDAKALLDELI